MQMGKENEIWEADEYGMRGGCEYSFLSNPRGFGNLEVMRRMKPKLS